MRNLTIQLDEDLIRAAKALAATKGMSLSALVAQDLREKIARQGRYQRAMAAALESMAEAAGSNRTAPVWTRDDAEGVGPGRGPETTLYDRRSR